MAGNSRRWLGTIRRALAGSSCKTSAAFDVGDHTDTTRLNELQADTIYYHHHHHAIEDDACIEEQAAVLVTKRELSVEDLAAIKIQACFRGHLARRAFRALRSLVKLQAVMRGVFVRRQSRIALHCMQALVRLQVRVRARQLLERTGEVEA